MSNNRKRTKGRTIQSVVGKPTPIPVTKKPRLRNILAREEVLRQIKHPQIPA